MYGASGQGPDADVGWASAVHDGRRAAHVRARAHGASRARRARTAAVRADE